MPSSDIHWIDAIGDGWSGPLRVRVRGVSMHPTLRPGDVVRVERAGPDELRPGDVVLFQNGHGALLHRFLGRTPEGLMRTRGDAMASPDPPWPPEALIGKAVGVEQQGRVVPIPNRPLYRAVRRGLARGMAFFQALLRLLALLLLLLVLAPLARAAVTLVSFTATPQGQAVLLQWETASEVNMLGFTVWRAGSEGGSSVPISDLIPAEGDIVGASYQFTDTSVEMGRTYFYWLEAVEVNGTSEFHGPVSVTVPLPNTATPTPTPTRTPAVTSTPTPTWTPTVPPSPTPTPTWTPTVTPPPTSVPTGTPALSPTPAPTTPPVPTRTPSPTPNSSPTPGTSPTPTPAALPAPSPSPTPTPGLYRAAAPASPPTPTPSPVPPGPASPTFALASGGISPPPGRTPGPAETSPSDSLPVGLVRALLVTGGAIGSGLVLFSLFILIRSRRPG